MLCRPTIRSRQRGDGRINRLAQHLDPGLVLDRRLAVGAGAEAGEVAMVKRAVHPHPPVTRPMTLPSTSLRPENAPSSEASAVIAAAAEKGFAMVDAPVSGGVAAATAGTLTFMAGGEADAFARARPVLEGMGKNIFHAGDAGNGQVAKICNNMLLGITMIATCEAFNLADKLGLDAQTFFDISSTASGQSWSMTTYCPAPGPVETAPSTAGADDLIGAASWPAELVFKGSWVSNKQATTRDVKCMGRTSCKAKHAEPKGPEWLPR